MKLLRLCLVSIAATGACSSSAATTSVTTASRTESVGSATQGSVRMVAVTDANVTNFRTALDDIWIALPGVYDTLQIAKVLIDNKQHVLSNQGQKIRSRLGRTPLSRYIDCGNTQIGPNADTYEVFLTVTTKLTPGQSGGTTLATTVEALARPITFNQEYSRCTSKGTLETRIAELMKLRVPG